LNCLAEAVDGSETAAGMMVAIIARMAELYFMVLGGPVLEGGRRLYFQRRVARCRINALIISRVDFGSYMLLHSAAA
jgi:hypothetical protein